MKFDHNVFPGINPYTHSDLLRGDWESFHAEHITDIARALRHELAPLGYIVKSEVGVQLRKTVFDEAALQFRKADVLVSGTASEQPPRQTGPAQAATPAVIPIATLLVDPEPAEELTAVALYEADLTGTEKLVAWLELISPANKPPNPGFLSYRTKRRDILKTGTTFVELDYIHSLRSTFATVASYKGAGSNVLPYRIAVMDPGIGWYNDGDAYLYEFGVLSAIPAVTIPLHGDEKVFDFEFDFGVPYNRTFDEMLLAKATDYSTPASDLLGYHDADKAAIAAHLKAAIDKDE
ncbi:MAG: DUF4058 family protein [Chloroflexota bacterium]